MAIDWKLEILDILTLPLPLGSRVSEQRGFSLGLEVLRKSAE